jgi:hypothetical protein
LILLHYVDFAEEGKSRARWENTLDVKGSWSPFYSTVIP